MHSWAELLDPERAVPYADIRRDIERSAKDVLAGLEACEHLSTTELVDKLWPETYCRPEDRDKRKRLFTWLGNTTHLLLPEWRRRGPPKTAKAGMMKGKVVRPWEWFNANSRWIQCPNCGCERKV